MSADSNHFALDSIFIFAFIVLLVATLYYVCRGFCYLERDFDDDAIRRSEYEIHVERLRQLAIQNVSITCDHANDYSRPLRYQTYVDRNGAQLPMYDGGVFPSDSFGISDVEAPPPSYEEVIRAK